MKILAIAAFATVLSVAGAAAATNLPQGAKSKYAQVNGIRMHYVQMGKGPLLVMLHGWPQTWFEWAHLMPALAKHYTVIAPSLRGTGLTEKTVSGYDKQTLSKDVADLIKHINLGPAYVVAHDMGGKAAYFLALQNPDLVSRLALVDCSPPGTENMDLRKGGLWHYGFHGAPEVPEMLTKGREREYITTMVKSFMRHKDAMSKEAMDEYVNSYSAPGGMTAGFNYYRALPEDARIASSLGPHHFQMPILTIGARDGVKENLYNAMKKVSDNVTGVVAEDSGHYIAEEAPEFLLEQIMKFGPAGK